VTPHVLDTTQVVCGLEVGLEQVLLILS